MIVYTQERAARGDIGPCNTKGCQSRAALTILLTVDHAKCVTWLCAAHAIPLRERYTVGS